MKSNSAYLRDSRSVHSSQSAARFSKILISLILSVMFASLGFGAVGSSNSAQAQTDPGEGESVSFDIVRSVMCFWGPEQIPGVVYQVSQTSDFQFSTQSKSSITSGIENVGTGPWGLNLILDLSGYDFEAKNEVVLGHPLSKVGNAVPGDDEEDPADDWNQGPRLTPFDRFGVSGMRFTGYAGEWKYLVVNACNPGSEPLDPKTGLYYEDRLVPQSVWEDRAGSLDIRSAQHSRGLASQMDMSFVNLIANLIFDLAKVIVVLTIAFINFAFSDIVSLLGVNELIGGTSTEPGLFTKLFEGVFQPLIVVVFALTGFHILWNGIVKRQYRTALIATIRSIGMWFAAIVIAANPSFWIAIPNQFAVVVQSVLVTSMGQGITGGEGMCTIGGTPTEVELVEDSSAEDIDLITQASENMRTVIGCSLWQQFLFVPWAQGQYGVSWNEVWAKDSIPAWAPEGASEVLNGEENAEMVGDAQVPLGGGTVLNNWALFQISTQTNAHSPIGGDGEYSKYTSGIANDWWRIVDALSNYEEETVTQDITSPVDGTVTTLEYTIPKATNHSPAWDVWTGNSIGGRLLASISAVFVAGIGVIAPMVFAFLSAVYALGVALLMAFAPIMLLLGCWAGRGWEIFKAWLDLVINTTLKRIIVGVLLVISILVSAAFIEIMETDNWWTGILFMTLVSIILIRSRGRISDTIATVRLSSADFSGSANRLVRGSAGVAKTSTKTVALGAAGGVAGGVASKRNGGSAIKGFSAGSKAGVRTELRNLSYKNKPLREGMRAYDSVRHQQGKDNDVRALVNKGEYCRGCELELDVYGFAYLDDVGNAYCEECGDQMGPEASLRVVNIRQEDTEKLDDKIPALETNYDESAIRELRKNSVAEQDEDTIAEQDEDTIAKDVRSVAKALVDDIESYRSARRTGLSVTPPPPPSAIAGYVDIQALNRAWKAEDWVYIKQVYSIAWETWAVDEFTGDFQNLAESILQDMDDVENGVESEDGYSEYSYDESDFDDEEKNDD